jgi:TetR/AcrR family transcriptional regulator
LDPHSPVFDTPARLPADERRRQLIEVAIDLFSRRGFSGTTTREIAAAAGVTEAIIFRHFATKQQLYTAILDYRKQDPRAQEWFAAIASQMGRNDDEALFRGLIEKIIHVMREDSKFERVLLYAALEGHELAAMYHEQFARPIRDLLVGYIERRQREGALRKLDPNALLSAMAGMATQYATHTHLCNYKDAGFSDEQAVETFTRILMDGIRTEQTK